VRTIWFNRTFSTHVHTVRGLRAGFGEPVRVVVSHPHPDSPMLAVADVAELEPLDVDDAVYVDWAVDLCTRHEVDVVVVGARAAALSGAAERFRAVGAELVAPGPAAIAAVEDKAVAYASAAAAGLPVPPHAVVRTGAELLAAFDALRPEGEVCVKPVAGSGGNGFRVLHDDPPSAVDLAGVDSVRLALGVAAGALDADSAIGPLLVMPVLPGPEISVDCLADRAGEPLAAVAREKRGHHRLIVDDPEAVRIAEALVRLHGLSHLSNTQVRYWARPGVDAVPRPYLLETNSRPSAGIHQTTAAGVDLVGAAIRVALGLPVHLAAVRTGADVIVVPTPLIVEPVSA
jgi:biotin carboxylase